MTSAEFRALILSKSATELLEPCVRADDVPFVFDPNPGEWNKFRQSFGAEFNVSPNDIRVVGSGRLGFSTKPSNGLKAFSETSDIDLLVVGPALFDDLWNRLLTAAYPRNSNLPRLGGHLRDLQNEVYTGFLTPVEFRFDPKIIGPQAKPVLEFRHQWFSALKRASTLPIRRHEKIQARLYRTWDHVNHYHLDSLASLQRSLVK